MPSSSDIPSTASKMDGWREAQAERERKMASTGTEKGEGEVSQLESTRGVVDFLCTTRS